MGRWKAWAPAWLLAATLSALLLQAPSARGDELLANGGFEDDTIHPWMAIGNGELASVNQPIHEGQLAARLTATGRGAKRVYQVVAVAGGGEYEFAGWVLKDEPRIERIFLSIEWCKSDQDALDCSLGKDESLQWITNDAELYQPITTGRVMGREAGDYARVTIAVEPVLTEPAIEGATVYLDDFSFTGPSAPTPTPSPTPPPTQTPLPTPSPSPSPGPIASPTPSPVASPSPTAAPTATEVPPTATPSPSAPTATRTPSAGLANPGFEEADGEGRPLGWRKYGGELRRSSAAKRQGQFAAVFTSRTTSTKWAFQTVAVEGGEAYVLSGYALKNHANVQSAYLRLSWYASSDGSGRAIDTVDSMTRLTDDFPDFRFLTTGPVVAPSEAASAKVRLMLDPFSEAEGKVYFDDISFENTTMPPPTQTAVPSPSPEATQTPRSPPSATRQGLAPPAAAPTAAAAEPQPPSSPTASRPSPTVLGARPGDSEAAGSGRDGVSQSEAIPRGTPPRTPLLLYRDRRDAQSIQEVEGVAAEADQHDGREAIVLILVMVPAAVAAVAAALLVWRRSQKGARPH